MGHGPMSGLHFLCSQCSCCVSRPRTHTQSNVSSPRPPVTFTKTQFFSFPSPIPALLSSARLQWRFLATWCCYSHKSPTTWATPCMDRGLGGGFSLGFPTMPRESACFHLSAFFSSQQPISNCSYDLFPSAVILPSVALRFSNRRYLQ